jgi:hypothetical protein
MKGQVPVFLNNDLIDDFLNILEHIEPNAARNSSSVILVHHIFVASLMASA